MERGRKVGPNLEQIRRLRILERAYERQLTEYYKIKKKYGVRVWGAEGEVFSKWEGYTGRKVMKKQYRSRVTLPDDLRYVDILGGLEEFSINKLNKSTE
jgi:hypothetical protein